ncbi:OmpA family protein [Fontimonas sp. SYSU GA230001]|uniref:OmpA/MotB family protein n=1 Tax=Fontimonas sp. SYSU GA230001 TaxID=3142450 RepID=UPI0032B43291
MRTLTIMLMLAGSLTACVTQETHRRTESALAGCQAERQAASETAANCAVRSADLDERLRGCQDASAVLREQLELCRARNVQAQATVSELDRRAAELREALQSEIAAKNVEIEQLRDRLSLRVLDRILFRSGSAEILPEGRAVLDKVAAALAAGSDTIRVEGHTDRVPIGPALQARYPTNWELSTARASSVVRYFQDRHAIAPTRLEAVGFSMYRPVTDGTSAEELQRNRRVEIVLSAKPD